MMKQIIIIQFFLLVTLMLNSSSTAFSTATINDVFWIDNYGRIPWRDEKARLSNLAVHLLNNPDQVGYIDVQVGLVSCDREAMRHALKAKRYLTDVRKVPSNRVVWRDVGYGESFEVTYWMVPLGKSPMRVYEYMKARHNHRVTHCKVN